MLIEKIIFRLFLAVVFAGIIGYEREVNQSNAGFKTHILVAIGATLIALLQLEIMNHVRELSLLTETGYISVTADASRLISQVVSGIGFLGAGTIIVTKRNVSGLTTAASIWATAGIGLALGMGFYEIAGFGFLFVILTLIIFNKVVNIHHQYRIIIKYLEDDKTLDKIKEGLKELDIEYELDSYKSEIFSDYTIRENRFIIKDSSSLEFEDIVSKFSKIENIISVERTNLF